MDRDIPAFNQLVINKINQKNQQLHEQRLQNIRSVQNSRAYLSTSMNARQNRKAQQIEEEKKTEIEKHNLMLFNKMKRIMNRPDPHNRPLLQNNRNNRASMELTKIQEENRTMYERIERQRPTISNKKLYEERQKNLNILKFLGKYSAHSIQSISAQNAQNIRASQTSSRTQNTFADRKKAYTVKPEHYLQDTETDHTHLQSKPRYDNNEFEEDADDDLNRMKAVIEAKRQKRAVEMKRKEQDQLESEGQDVIERSFNQRRVVEERPSVPRSAKDITLYKTTRDINHSTYEIRILRKHLTYQIRCSLINSFEQPIRLQLSEEEGTCLLEQNNYDYASIIDRLKITNGKLILSNSQSNPVSETAVIARQRQEDLLAQIKNKRKNQFPYLNASHISEQNQEDSYQIDVKPSVLKNDDANDLDSLGQEEEFEKYTTEELSESQNNVNFKLRPANFQEKLQQIKESKQQAEDQLDPPGKYEIQPQNESQGPIYQEEQPHGNYEQALDEQID